MEENTNSSIEDKLNEVGHILLQTKRLTRLSALAFDACVIDEELQLQDSLEYYFVLRQIANLLNKIENLIQDQVLRFITRIN